MSNDSKNKSLAAILGGGCLIYSVFSILLTAGVMVWLAVSVSSCAEKRAAQLAENEAYLNRFTESSLPETLALGDNLVFEKKFATEYTPIDSEYDTVILENRKMLALWGAVNNEIVVTFGGAVITDDYHHNITYNYRDYSLGENVPYFAYEDGGTVYFISPDGEELKTEPKEELSSLHSDTTETSEAEEELRYKIVRQSDDELLYGIESSDGELLVEYEFTLAHRITDDIFFLKNDERSCFYNAEENELIETSADMEYFYQEGDCFAAVTYSDRGEKVYTIYN